MITGILLPSDEDTPISKIEVDTEDTEAVEDIVLGGYEVLNFNAPPASLLGNEGLTLWDLQHNHRATILLWLHAPDYRYNTHVPGPAIITGRPDGTGKLTSVPSELVTLLLETESYRVEVLMDKYGPWVTESLVFATWMEAYKFALLAAQMHYEITDVRVIAA
ncbi:hypothetical protein ACFRMN_19685 [Streptomyces sp. NPDC056835]|uniref:hypothetical protein n=1 Tax=Streptomyces sp. NPDC056835 TaxID=3345956 RepID=UPI0036A3AABB